MYHHRAFFFYAKSGVIVLNNDRELFDPSSGIMSERMSEEVVMSMLDSDKISLV